jgi:hypothetical protein
MKAPMAEELPHLAEALRATAFPRHGQRQWLADLEAFCDKHGGERHYADLLRLIRACRREVDKEER